MAKVIALIPARSGSKGVPNKNIRELAGHPLLAYSVVAAKKTKLIDRVIVSTDSSEYASIALAYGAEVPFLRPGNLAQDDSTDIDFFQHCIDWFLKTEGFSPEYFVHLRPTTPLRDPLVISNAIDFFIHNNFTSLRSVHEMSESAYKTFEIIDNKLARVFTGDFELDSANYGRQSYPKTYDANGYVDIVRSDLIKNSKLLHGDGVFPFLTERSYEIDHESDIPFLEWTVRNNNEIFRKIFEDA